MPFFKDLKEKLRARRDRAKDGEWEDILNNRECRHTDLSYSSPHTTTREFSLLGGYALAIRQDTSSPRSSHDLIFPRSSRERQSIYDLKLVRDLFASPCLSNDLHSLSRDSSRGREMEVKLKKSAGQHRRRRRKSSHPKVLSRNRSSINRAKENMTSLESISAMPKVQGGIFGGSKRSEHGEKRKEAERFEADKECLQTEKKNTEKQDKEKREKDDRGDWKQFEEKDRKFQKRVEKEDREKQKQVRKGEKKHREQIEKEGRENQKQLRKEYAEKQKQVKAKEAAKAAGRLTRIQLEERIAREEKDPRQQVPVQPERAATTNALTEANLRAAREKGSDSGDSAKSELDRGIGNMARTYLEGMLPPEEVLKGERKRREEAVRQKERERR
jgi:hypothetical protein